MRVESPIWPSVPRLRIDTVTTRSAVIGTIALIVLVMGVIAVAAMFAGDIPERSGGIIATVLGGFATVLAGLLLFLRMDTVNAKVDEAAVEAKDARAEAQRAAVNAAVAARKTQEVHYDILNGGLRENVKKALVEAETDPTIRAARIENVQRGVQADRHTSGSREQAAYARGVADAMKRVRRERGEEADGPHDA